MKKTVLLPLLSAAALLSVSVFGAEIKPTLLFSKAVITEVVNNVEVVNAKTLVSGTAKKDDTFFAPDMLRTGRKSRAQLLMSDGTVVRVGSNAVFSFEPESRTIRLKNGTVLFHSPQGKGGGTIVTTSAAASVIGTTIMVTATSDGGFKLMVLEGVGKVTLPRGGFSELNAGQMTFILPGEEALPADFKRENSPANEAPVDGKRGPVLHFDLNTLTSSSGLLNGFSDTIASVGKINGEVVAQNEKIADGDLRETGLVILGASSQSEFSVADLASVMQQNVAANFDSQNNALPAGRMDVALSKDVDLGRQATVSDEFIFRDPVAVPGINAQTGLMTGVVAKSITLSGGTSNLSVVGDLPTVTLAAPELLFVVNTKIEMSPVTREVIFVANTIRTQNGSGISTDFGTAGGKLSVIGQESWSAAGSSFSVDSGDLRLSSAGGDLTLSDTALSATKSASGAGGNITLDAAGKLEIQSAGISDDGMFAANAAEISIAGQTDISTGSINLDSNKSIRISDTNMRASGGEILFSGADISVQGTTLSTSPGQGITLRADNSVSLQNSALSGDKLVIESRSAQTPLTSAVLNGLTFPNVSPTNFEVTAGTISLGNINFAGGSQVLLRSTDGTFSQGSTSVTGAVNFLNNVTYSGENAANYVYVPLLNIGDIECPIHILPVGAIDSRMSKVDYALSHDLEFFGTGVSQKLGNNFVFAKPTQLTPAQLGISGELAALLPESLVFVGYMANSLTFGGGKAWWNFSNFGNTDFSDFSAPTVKFYGNDTHIGRDAPVAFSAIPSTISVIEIGGKNLTVESGATIKATFSEAAADNVFRLRTPGALSFDNVTLNVTHGNISLESLQDISITGGTLTAGCSVSMHPGGEIRLLAQLGTLTLTDATVHGTVSAANISAEAKTVTIQGGEFNAPAKIAIRGTTLVSIRSGRLVSSNVDIREQNAGGALERIDVDGVQFSGAQQIAMAAKTITVRNVDFPGGSQVSLNSQDGALNIMGSRDAVFGAVNFQSGTVRYNGADITNAGGINSLVHVSEGTGKILVDGRTSGFTGADASSAKVTIGKM